MMDGYGIEPGYRARTAARSFDDGGGERYWTAARLALSGEWQYYVYRLARDLIRRRGCKNVLDVGSGPGAKLRELIDPVCADVVMVDQSPIRAVAERTVPGARFVAADLAEIDLDLGRRFDVVICSDVLEHLLDPDPCLEFVRRHLAPDAVAVLSTPDRDHLRGPGCMQSPHAEHVREWSGAEFRAYLESRGFTVERQDWLPARRTNTLDFAVGRLLGRLVGRRRWASCQVAVVRAAGPRSRSRQGRT